MKSKIIYTIILISIICVFIALPFIWLDIYSTSRGILRPIKERSQIISLNSGKIDSVFIKQNQFVKKGDTLLIINNIVGKTRLDLFHKQKEDIENFITDLSYLLKTKNAHIKKIKTHKYQKEYIQYQQQLRDYITRYNKEKRDFERQDKLFKKNVIAKVEHENSKYTFDLAKNNFAQFKKQKKNNWQADLTQLTNSIKEFDSNIKNVNEDNLNYIITSPINGTIQNLIGVEKGSFIVGGKTIADISPESELIAECFVMPQDIGLLKIESQVSFQIDAFNYNQWGMATGIIIDINKDITIVENRPMFRVVCKIEQQHLSLKNGFEGKLKKGMTFNARFFIIKRTAYELLYDKIDDWFVPGN